MTHALFYICRGHVAEAASWHPLIFLLPIMGIIYFFSEEIPDKWENRIWVTIGMIFIVVYFIRKFVFGAPVLDIHLENGLLTHFFVHT